MREDGEGYMCGFSWTLIPDQVGILHESLSYEQSKYDPEEPEQRSGTYGHPAARYQRKKMDGAEIWPRQLLAESRELQCSTAKGN
ncbi:hypothetical protein FH972_005616 [Carpinus fangiana]|uniref:Uncharacterized protein n=1 Tax=Carpinus fangiana TaxID=176857 RepID=A0A5N6QQ52_9ROSI|nr:hypothetical protein FH972_005616 [Carpinus fangiana]